MREAADLVCDIRRRSLADWIPLLMEARRQLLMTQGGDGMESGCVNGGKDIIWW